MHTLKGCTALITGASAGLGAEFVRQLAPHARCLVLVARRRERIEELAAEVMRPGLAVHCFGVDVGNAEQLDAFLSDLAATGENVSLLINNAGCGDHGLFEDSEWAKVQAMIDVNIAALTKLTHALVPQLVKAGNGGILNVSSIASLLPLPQMAIYAATKAYVTSFTEALRCELRGSGVSVTMVCPGPVDTEFAARADRSPTKKMVPAPEFFKVPAAQVVSDALGAVLDDRARIIPGWRVFIVMTLATLVPMFLLRFALNRRGRFFNGH